MRLLVGLVLALFIVEAVGGAKKSDYEYKLEALVKSLNVEDFHQFHIEEFVGSDGFGMERVVAMPKMINLQVDGKEYYLKNMRLISTTDRKKPVIWELKAGNQLAFTGPLERRMFDSGMINKRELNKKEAGWVAALKKQKKHIITTKEDQLSLIAPLIAEAACIRCHEDYKKGEFMGAFLYDTYSIGKGLDKKGDSKEAEKKGADKEKKAGEVSFLTK